MPSATLLNLKASTYPVGVASTTKENKKITLQFLDSYQLLLASLKNLALAFDCDTLPSLFFPKGCKEKGPEGTGFLRRTEGYNRR